MSRAVVLVVCMLGLLVSGCGGDDGPLSKADYEKQFVDFSKQLTDALQPIGQDLDGATDLKLIASRLDDGAKVLDETASDFDGITPPADITAAHDKIVSGVRDIAKLFRDGAKQARDGDRNRLFDTLQNYTESPGPVKIAEASAEYRAKGYRQTAEK